MARLPSIPKGKSFCGLRASCAATDTASKPMYAKKMTPAPAKMPLKPNSPNVPVFGGMKGCQFSATIARMPTKMNVTTTPTLTKTISVFTFADSRIPTTRIAEMIRTMRKAGRLNRPAT